ncbi:hypothetical protein HNR19_000353 [Nocardioides thalensis]|uniref:Uncharacterized protein n=1 Tax=Nocardioides thalensis TaxID=1914755 RepID=A0A853BX19_9ACTN|nr:hypothetical protein [Nocardioides thalensis]NYI99654.1 hypothetical protein [Nocardioides thalensis]
MTRQFDRGALTETLDVLQADLADLAHIEAVVDMRERFYVANNHPAGPFDLAEDVLGYDFQVGRRYPFEVSVYGILPGSQADRWKAEIAEARRQAEGWAEDLIDSARAALSFIVDPQSRLLELAVSELEQPAEHLVRHIPSVFERVAVELGDWQGEAKHAFDTFIGDARRATDNQGWLAESLRIALANAKAVIDLGQLALLEGLTHVRSDLDQQLRKRVEEERGAESRIRFFLLAATATGVVGSLAIPIPGVALAAIAASSPLLGLVKDSIPQADARLQEVPVRSATDYASAVESVVDNVVDGTRLRWDTAVAEGALKIQRGVEDVGNLHGRDAFEPPTPTRLESGPVDGGFHHPAQR